MTSPLTSKLSEIKQRADAASKAPWIDDNHGGLCGAPTNFAGEYRPADARFISHARQDIPRLLKALELAIEQRNEGYDIWSDWTEDDAALLAVLEGE